MTKEELAAEAQRLKENEAAQKAIAQLRSDALESLAKADPTDADDIRASQALVRAADQFLYLIEGYILNGQGKNKPGIV